MRGSLAGKEGFLDEVTLQVAYRAYCGGSRASLAELWRALSLELWLRFGHKTA